LPNASQRYLPERIAREVAAFVGTEEAALVQRDVIEVQTIAKRQNGVFGERHARPKRAAGGRLLERRVALAVATEIEAVQIPAIDVGADRNISVEQIWLGEAELRRL
jgi:hypothetical protein